jgi:hypothetical protein
MNFVLASMRRLVLWICLPILTVSLVACGGGMTGKMNSTSPMSSQSSSASPDATPLPESTAGHHIKNVFLIMMENHNWTGNGSQDIKDSSEAPYINKTLVPMGAHPSQYYNPPHIHPSLPNYLWLEAGTNFGILNDHSIAANSQTTTLHLVTLLKNAGISWKSYNEWATGTICPLGQWHTPFVFFDDVTGHLNPYSSYCISHIRPFSELSTDLKDGKTAHYNFIVPNLCHSMHSYCGENQIKAGDTWLREHVTEILDSAAYKDGGVIFIVFDEASKGDGPIPVLILSPYAKRDYTNNAHYTHGSTLRTVEEIFGVAPLMRNAANEPDLRDFFTEFP